MLAGGFPLTYPALFTKRRLSVGWVLGTRPASLRIEVNISLFREFSKLTFGQTQRFLLVVEKTIYLTSILLSNVNA